MFFFSLFLKERDPKYEENEVELYRVKRHWMVLVQRLLPIVLLLLLVLMVIFFRMSGGRIAFLDGERRSFDVVSGLMVGGIALLLGFYVQMRRTKSKRIVGANVVLGFAFLLLLFLLFYLAGGQLVSFDGASSGFDGLNLLLAIVAFGLLLAMDWVGYDWKSDDLILTNLRVIQEDYIPLIRDFRNQILIDDVQSVVAKTDTYIQNLLGYGTIIVQSAAQSRIYFAGADSFPSNPDPLTGRKQRNSVFRKKLQDEIDRRRKERDPRSVRSLVEKHVYGTAPPPAVPPVSVPAGHKGNWIFPENPEIRTDKDRTIIWRKFWLFEAIQLLGPLLGLLVLATALFLLYRNTTVAAGTLLASGLIVGLGLLFWAWYIVTDYRNDLYVLTLSNLIDIEKKPLGPENRRSAGLGQIQNVNYQTTFWGNLLGYGDVFIQTAGTNATFTFLHVPRPREVATTINDYLNSFREGDKERSLRESLALLKEYHSAQLDKGELRDPRGPARGNAPLSGS